MKKKKYTKIATAMLCANLLIPANMTFAKEAMDRTLNEITSSASVSALNQEKGHAVSNILDGKLDTYWQSNNHYRFVDIDLNGMYNLDQITLFGQKDTSYYYNIYVTTDGTNYKKVAVKQDDIKETGNGISFDLKGVEAGKIRIDVPYNSKNDYANLSEVEIFGKKTEGTLAKETPIKTTTFEESKWSKEYNKVETDQSYAKEKVEKEMGALVGRVIGEEYMDMFVFEQTADTGENDKFTLSSTSDGKIKIQGKNGVSIASGFNYYLKEYANVFYNPEMASNLKMPETLPLVEGKVVKDTPYDYRYALNFCTFSYTMAFWNWEDYERFIDWGAMNGVNLMLNIVGQEEVLRKTLNEFGYSNDEVKEYISGPAYFAWFYMQNMTSLGGPLPNDWFEERAELGRQMHDRMQTYGISPVLQGYSGGVPLDFTEKNPKAQVISQGGWCGFDRPDMLKTYVGEGQEDYFQKVAKVFYEKQTEVFGDVTDYYGVDPFHEGGNTGDLNQGKIYKTIQDTMMEYDKDAVWVIQSWQGNPNAAKLEGLSKPDQAIVLDLFSEVTSYSSVMENTDTPWIWNMLHNFGGRMGMDGQPTKVAKVSEAYKNSEHMVGIGMTPEAFNTNPYVYDLLYDMTWEKDDINLVEWTDDYIKRRYGEMNKDAKQAWIVLLDTAYAERSDYYQGAAESVINARPSTNINSASTWGYSKVPYDKETFEKAAMELIEAYDELKDNEAFRYDFVDVMKQVLANSSQEYHKEMVAAYENGDLIGFNKISSEFLELIKLQDEILSAVPEFQVENWIEQARTMMPDADDWTKDLFEYNARALVTTWGLEKNANGGGLKDYSNRQWSGLTEDYYLPRWEAWVDVMKKNLETGSNHAMPNWYMMESKWVHQKTSDTEVAKENDVDLLALGKEAIERFSVTNMKENLNTGESIGERENIAFGKEFKVNVATESSSPLSNLTDGNLGTAWKAASSTWPVELELNFEKNESVNGIDFAVNQAAGGFPVDYKVEVKTDAGWQQIAEQSGQNITGTISIPYVGVISDLRITLNSMDTKLIPEVTEVMVYKGESKNYENLAKGKNVVVSAGSSSAANLTDDDEKTLWSTGSGSFPASAQVNFNEPVNADQVEVVFEKAGLRFQYKVEVIDENGNRKTLKDATGNTEDLPKRDSINLKEPIQSVIVTLTGRAPGGDFSQAWPCLAEVKVLKEKQLVIPKINVAENKSVVGSTSQSGKPASNIVDGDPTSLFISEGGKMPLSATIDLGEETFVDNLEVFFEKEDLRFKYKVQVENQKGEKTEVFNNMGSQGTLGVSDNIDVNKNISKIHVSLEGKGAGGAAQGAWAAIAEIYAWSKPQDALRGSKVSSNIEGLSLENLTDNDDLTTVTLNQEGQKEFTFKTNKPFDFNTIEIIKSTLAGQESEPLKYTVAVKNSAGQWETIIDKSKNSINYDVIVENVSYPRLTDEIKLTVLNNVNLHEVRAYSADTKSKLVSYIGKVQDVLGKADSSKYPEASIKQLEAALDKANDVLSNNPNSVETDAALNELRDALYDFYSSYTSVDRNKLLVLLEDVKIVLGIDYNSLSNVIEAKKALEAAYEVGKEVNDKKQVTQKDIDAAYDSLKTALDEYLEVLSAKEKVDTLIVVANSKLEGASIGEGNGQYPAAKVNAVKEVLASIGDDTASLTAEQLQNFAELLQNSLLDLDESKIIIDLEGVKQLIADLEEVLKVAGPEYPSTAKEALKMAIEFAKYDLEQKHITQAQVDAILHDLKAAEYKFEISKIHLDYQQLKLALQEADQVKEYDMLSFVSDEVVKAFEIALDEAQKLLQDQNATQKKIDDAVVVLRNATHTVKMEYQKYSLKELIKTIESIKQKDYTKESYKVFKDVLKEAEKFVKKESNPTLHEINQMYERLMNAYLALEKK